MAEISVVHSIERAEALNAIRLNAGGRCASCGGADAWMNPLTFHFKDGDPTNLARENVALLCNICHEIGHGLMRSAPAPDSGASPSRAPTDISDLGSTFAALAKQEES